MIIEPIIIFLTSIITYHNNEKQQPISPQPVKTEIKTNAPVNDNTLLRGGWDRN